MEIILWIVGVIVVLIVIYGLFYGLCTRYPWIRFVLALAIGISTYFLWGIWWLSLLLFFMSFGIIISMTQTTTRRGTEIKCGECGHDMLDVISEDDHHISYRCYKCNHKGTVHLYR